MASAAQKIDDPKNSSPANHPSEAVVVRFAGDSGDGMQLTGGQFTLSSALAGNDFATFPDFPAEIRAPQGTLFGVSAFQINFGSDEIDTAGDAPDVLVAMNPAALKTNVKDLKPGGLIIADSGEFSARNLGKAEYESNPLEDGSLANWQLIHFNISQLTMDAVKPFGLGNKEALFPYEQPALFSMPLAFFFTWLFSVTDGSARAKTDKAGYDDQYVRSQTGIGAAAASAH